MDAFSEGSMRTKLLVGLGILGVVVASAVTFRLVTGECPVAATMRAFGCHCNCHKTASQPATAN
jgi:hypothetical protein